MLTKFAKFHTTRDEHLIKANYSKPDVDNRKSHKTAYRPSELSISNAIEIFDVSFSRVAKKGICHDSMRTLNSRRRLWPQIKVFYCLPTITEERTI